MVQPKSKGEVQENLGAIGPAGLLSSVAWTQTLGGNPVGEGKPALFHPHGAASFRPPRSAPCETRRLCASALESDQTGQSLIAQDLSPGGLQTQATSGLGFAKQALRDGEAFGAWCDITRSTYFFIKKFCLWGISFQWKICRRQNSRIKKRCRHFF